MSKLFSRKFILTLLFVAAVCLDFWVFDKAIGWEVLTVLGGTIGVYNLSNAIKGYRDIKKKK